MRTFIRALALAACVLTFTTCGSFPIDPFMRSAQGKDFTLTMSGFGVLVRDGYLFARVNEGNRAGHRIYINFPQALQCGQDRCAFGYLMDRNGSVIRSIGARQGETQISFTLSEILGHEVVDVNDDDEYGVALTVLYTNPSGNLASIDYEGLIRLKVLHRNYTMLGCDSAHVAWRKEYGPNCTAQYTTAGRVALCGGGC